MKLSKYIKVYQDLTSKASDSTRALAFAGIAIIWIFNKSDKFGASLPSELVIPAFLFALALASDLFHYIYGGISYFFFYKIKIKQVNDMYYPKVESKILPQELIKEVIKESIKNETKEITKEITKTFINEEIEEENNPSFSPPKYINYPMWVFYWVKISCVIFGYIYLIKFLFSSIKFN